MEAFEALPWDCLVLALTFDSCIGLGLQSFLPMKMNWLVIEKVWEAKPGTHIRIPKRMALNYPLDDQEIHTVNITSKAYTSTELGSLKCTEINGFLTILSHERQAECQTQTPY